MGKTFTNNIVDRETSIAIEQLLIAPEGTSWDGAKIDIAVPPTGFVALGAVDEESSVISVTRSKLELRTGIPQVLQYDAVTALEGKISAILLSNSNRKAVYALGAADIINVSPAAITVINSTATNPITSTVITFAAAPAIPPVVGDEIIASVTIAAWDLSTNVATVASVDPVATTTVYFLSPGFSVAPNDAEFAARPIATRLALGTSVIKRYHLLGVADFIDGSQIVHQFQKVSAFGEWVEEVRASQTGRIPVSFDAFGYTTTDFNNGTSELVLGERYQYQ